MSLTNSKRAVWRKTPTPLRDKRMVFIFDECHRSQFGENHKAIKEFFPKAQLFGFTGTPIFEDNATYVQVEGEEASRKTTLDLFQKQLHAYTITHAIDDQNVLGFHIDYYKPEVEQVPLPREAEPSQAVAKPAIVDAILAKHDKATAQRKFNAILATASINDAIDYHRLFKEIQAEKAAADDSFRPLNIACVFSPPAYGNKDVQQIQEDLPQEKADNTVEPEQKKAALMEIMADYNARYGTNHDISNFDLYYQNVQGRIKDQQYPNRDLPRAQKVDLVIVVDMLLTGFDSKYLNTLYVDKNLRYHGLIQALSRTNRVLNDTKPNGHILDFRQQEKWVDEAIKLFSGEFEERAKEIWLAPPAAEVIAELQEAVKRLDLFMQSEGLAFAPHEVPNLKGDAARSLFINRFKAVQRLNTKLAQYTDLTEENNTTIAQLLPPDTLQGFKGVYLELAQRLQSQQDKGDDTPEVQQLEFEFVLFASAIIDYDYIMALLARYEGSKPGKATMTEAQLIGLIASDATLMDQRDDIVAYIKTLQPGGGRTEAEIRAGYEAFKDEQNAQALAAIATQHGLETEALNTFVDLIIRRMIFDGEQLTDLLAPLELGWKARSQKERALMADLIPHLHKLAQGRKISGLEAYEQ